MTSLASTNQMIRRESAARENCYGAVPREHLLLEETSYKHKPPEQNIHRSSNTYHTEHRRHCTNMIKCFWQRKPQKKCSIAQGTLSNHYKLLGANHVFAKEQDGGQVKLIPQNSTHCRTLCARAGRPSCSPMVALVVGRGKINQEINYYNAKIGSVAPNIENKMKKILFLS